MSAECWADILADGVTGVQRGGADAMSASAEKVTGPGARRVYADV